MELGWSSPDAGWLPIQAAQIMSGMGRALAVMRRHCGRPSVDQCLVSCWSNRWRTLAVWGKAVFIGFRVRLVPLGD